MRKNSPLEMGFQLEIIQVFEKYDAELGFPAMADNLLAWLIHEMRDRMKGKLTYFSFIVIMTKTWNDLTRLKKAGLI